MRKIIAAGVLAFSWAMTAGAVTSNADNPPLEGSYVTQTACLNEGASRFPQLSAQNKHMFVFECRQHDDGLWYLYPLKFE